MLRLYDYFPFIFGDLESYTRPSGKIINKYLNLLHKFEEIFAFYVVKTTT